MPHQVCDFHANFQGFQTNSFEIEGYLKEYLRFFHLISCRIARIKKELYSPPKAYRIEGPQQVFGDVEFTLFERRDPGF